MTDDEKRKYPISFREGFTVFMCLGVSLAAIMALVIYVGFFWYLEQQRQLKGKSQKLSISFGSVDREYNFIFKRYLRRMNNSNQNVFKWPKSLSGRIGLFLDVFHDSEI